MTAIFLRFYVALAAVVALLAALLVALPDGSGADELPARVSVLAAAPHRVAEALAAATTPAARDAAVAALSDELGAPVTIVPLALARHRLDAVSRDRLDRGEAVTHPWESAAALLVRVPDQPLVAVLQPEPPTPVPWRTPLLVAALGLGLGLSVLITLRPLQRQMTELSAAATRLGDGETRARAAVVSRDASGEVAATFNTMAERVEALVRAREELLLAVAHELRTPLSRLRFAIELLADADDADDREAQRVEVEGDIEELEALVSELLAFASLGDGRRPLDAAPLDLAQAARDLTADAARLRVEVTVQVGDLQACTAPVEGRLWRRAARNLLSNAMRYTASEVAVSMWVDGDRAVFQVDDDGPGVAPADRERVFEPLVRLDAARTRDQGGVGMGLALARRIARTHGGDLTVEDAELGGASFRLAVPLAPSGVHAGAGSSTS